MKKIFLVFLTFFCLFFNIDRAFAFNIKTSTNSIIHKTKRGLNTVKNKTARCFKVTKNKTTNGLTTIKDKTVNGSKTVKYKTVNGYRIVKKKTKNGYKIAKEKTKKGYNNTKAKLVAVPEPVPKMVETSQQWQIAAQNVPLEDRQLADYSYPSGDKKNYVPRPNYVFETYNYPQGKRELNLESLKKKGSYTSPMVVDSEITKGAYVQYYFSPDSNQISSSVFVEDLDTSRGRKDRIINFKPEQQERYPIVESGTKEIYPNLFNGFSIVDFSKDGRRLLIKEKVGSTINGIYKTYIYVYYSLGDYTLKLTDLDDTIKAYYKKYDKLLLTNYRYDIEPLGFSASDDNIIILLLWIYDKNNQKVFLGSWGYDTNTKDIMIISKTNSSNYVSANGLILKKVVD